MGQSHYWSEQTISKIEQATLLVGELVITEIALNGDLMQNYFHTDASVFRTNLNILSLMAQARRQLATCWNICHCQ